MMCFPHQLIDPDPLQVQVASATVGKIRDTNRIALLQLLRERLFTNPDDAHKLFDLGIAQDTYVLHTRTSISKRLHYTNRKYSTRIQV